MKEREGADGLTRDRVESLYVKESREREKRKKKDIRIRDRGREREMVYISSGGLCWIGTIYNERRLCPHITSQRPRGGQIQSFLGRQALRRLR